MLSATCRLINVNILKIHSFNILVVDTLKIGSYILHYVLNQVSTLCNHRLIFSFVSIFYFTGSLENFDKGQMSTAV